MPYTLLGAAPKYSTEQFVVILRQLAREKRRHSGAMSRLFAGELAEKRREVRSVAIFRNSPYGVSSK